MTINLEFLFTNFQRKFFTFVQPDILINKEESVDIRFGLLNAIDTYLRLNIRVVLGDFINLKCFMYVLNSPNLKKIN